MTPFLSNSQQPNVGFEDRMINVTINVCSIVTMPVELALRPFHGTCYFSPVIMVFSGGMMLVAPLIFSFAGAFSFHQPGLIGMWGFSKLFFLGSFVHGFRKWLLMLNMEREQHSQFEGPPLFFFKWLPGSSFWRVRNIFEPLFLIAVSIVGTNFFILEPPAASFLVLSAFALAMKGYARWFLGWQYLRKLMDARAVGPIIADLADNRATEDDLAQIHLASFPKDLSEDMRRDAVEAIRRRILG